MNHIQKEMLPISINTEKNTIQREATYEPINKQNSFIRGATSPLQHIAEEHAMTTKCGRKIKAPSRLTY